MISDGAWVVLSPGCPTFRSTIFESMGKQHPLRLPSLGFEGTVHGCIIFFRLSSKPDFYMETRNVSRSPL